MIINDRFVLCNVRQFLAKGALHDIQLDDVGDFELTDKAMSHLGLSDTEKLAIYGIVAGVLHLGNIMFQDDPGSKGWSQRHRPGIIIIIFIIIIIRVTKAQFPLPELTARVNGPS